MLEHFTLDFTITGLSVVAIDGLQVPIASGRYPVTPMISVRTIYSLSCVYSARHISV
jgi:hypothetical protein